MMPSSRSGLVVGLALAVVLAGVVSGVTAGARDVTDALDDGTGAAVDDASADRAVTPTRIDSCTTIGEPGRYVLAGDVNGNPPLSSACIEVAASDVTLDGRGHAVDGNGVSDTTGVLVANVSNVTVRNLRVTDWNRGVYVRDASDVTVRGVTAVENAIGVDVRNADARVVGVRAERNLHGVALADPGDDVLRRTETRGNHVVGVYAPFGVEAFGVGVSLGPPLDADGDGRYEDLTGNGRVGVWDVAALPAVVTTHYLGANAVTADQRLGLDFDDDGNLDYGDVLAYAGLER